MNKNTENILEKIRNEYAVKNFQPFLNSYYWNPDMNLVSCYLEKVELYNESILILDEEDEYSDEPYIMSIDRERLAVLMEYFSTNPIHQTNRIAVTTNSRISQKEQYNNIIGHLVSRHIKPAIIITFSQSVGDYVKNNYTIYMHNNLKETKCWKGIVFMGDRYFFLYCLPNIADSIKSNGPFKSKTEASLKEFFLSSSVYDRKTCGLLNRVNEAMPSFQFPENPLEEPLVRTNLQRLTEIKNTQTPNFLFARQEIKNVCSLIKNFDEHDILAAQCIIYSLPEQKQKLSCEEYVELRKQQNSKDICHKYIESNSLNYRIYLLQLALVQFTLFTLYPEETFKADWEYVRVISECFIDMYRDAVRVIK
ncbi:MAG TPA: hypothetical protein P5295_15340 [Spirochaetota bacterium]|nr:hypothetical protein [Spirochaetota bacterium]